MNKSTPFPFTCLEVNCLNLDYLEKVCAYAKRFHIRAIGHMAAEWREFQTIDHSEWGVPPINDDAKKFMENYQDNIRKASEYVDAQGLDFYFWRRELRLPIGFIEKYGVKWVDFENPELWDLVRWNLKAHFDLFPKMKGIFLTCTGEQKPGEWITANGIGGKLPLWQRFEKMFRTVQETCDAHNRHVIFRNHGAGNDGIPLALNDSSYMGNFIKAAKNFPKDTITLMGKAVEPDFQPGYSFNSILTHMAAAQPTYAEFSLPMEYNSVSRTPFPMVEDIKFRLLTAQGIGCKGAVARIDWHMSQHQTKLTWTTLGNVNELNVYTFCRLVNEIGTPVEEIYADFAKERFGEKPGKVILPILKTLFEAGHKTYYEFGNKGCMTPSGAPLNPDRLFPSLNNDPAYRWSYSPVDYANYLTATAPDAHYIKRIETEKNEALAIYNHSLDQIKRNISLFTNEDADMLLGRFERVIREAAIRRDYMVAYYAWLAYDQTGDESYDTIASAALKTLTPLIEAFCETYDPLDWEPDSKLGFAFGDNSRKSAQMLTTRLAESRAFWSEFTGKVLPTRYSKHFNQAIEIPLPTGRLTINVRGCSIVEISDGNHLTVPAQPSFLLAFHVGGLLEQGTHVGRSFVKSRTVTLADKTEETTIRFAYEGTSLIFKKLPKANGLAVRIICGKISHDGILHLPWLDTLGGKIETLPASEIQKLAATLPESAKPIRGWKCTLPQGGSFALLDASQDASPAELPDGPSWKISKQADLLCYFIAI